MVTVVPGPWGCVVGPGRGGFRLLRPRGRGRQGERTLRDAYAKGEVSEAEYRERLAVLRETRR